MRWTRYGRTLRWRLNILWHVVFGVFCSADKRLSDFRDLCVMACRISSSLFLSRRFPTVWSICKNKYHLTMSRCDGTCLTLYWRMNARWIFTTLENFAYHTTHWVNCCGVTIIFTQLCISTEHVRQRTNMYHLCTWRLVIALWTTPLSLLTPIIFTYITENCIDIYSLN